MYPVYARTPSALCWSITISAVRSRRMTGNAIAWISTMPMGLGEGGGCCGELRESAGDGFAKAQSTNIHSSCFSMVAEEISIPVVYPSNETVHVNRNRFSRGSQASLRALGDGNVGLLAGCCSVDG